MSQIPAYLTALADLCDKHGTHAKHMGPELRLLAGLPWKESVTPADVARAWLTCSRARVTEVEINDGLSAIDVAHESDVDRAAACAELAVLSAAMEHHGAAGTYPGIARPHQGTPEGARAAWRFVVEHVQDMANEWPHTWGATAANYRRELEAMK